MGPREGATVTSGLYHPSLLAPEKRNFISQDLDTNLREELRLGLLWSSIYPLDLFPLLGSRYHHWPNMDHVSITEIRLGEGSSWFLPLFHLWAKKGTRKSWDSTRVFLAFRDNLFLQVSATLGDTEPVSHFTFKAKLCPFALLIHLPCPNRWQ